LRMKSSRGVGWNHAPIPKSFFGGLSSLSPLPRGKILHIRVPNRAIPRKSTYAN
jgi:hypothetical protein